MNRRNYYLKKDNKTGEVLYLEFDKIDGYNVTPKTKLEDAIKVDKIVFVNPGLSEKIIRKKIEIKIRGFLKVLEDIDNDPAGGDEDGIKRSLMDAERLKLMILNEYKRYLGNTYGSYSIKKIQIIINQLRIKLYDKVNQRRMYEAVNNYNNLYYLDEEEPSKGRGR